MGEVVIYLNLTSNCQGCNLEEHPEEVYIDRGALMHSLFSKTASYTLSVKGKSVTHYRDELKLVKCTEWTEKLGGYRVNRK